MIKPVILQENSPTPHNIHVNTQMLHIVVTTDCGNTGKNSIATNSHGLSC